MKFDSISNERAAIWFSADELDFLSDSLTWVLKELEFPDEFATRNGRTVTYAHKLMAVLRDAAAWIAAFKPLGEASPMPTVERLAPAQVPNTHPYKLRATVRIEAIAKGRALLSMTDHELRFLNNVLNEAAHGVWTGPAFLDAIGKSIPYARRFMDRLVDGSDRIEALRYG